MKLTLENISFQHQSSRHNNKNIFDNFSASFQQDSLSVLSGANGTGKSTMLALIAGIKKCQNGYIVFTDPDGVKREPSLEDISYFTQFYENLFFSVTVKTEILQTIRYSNSSFSYHDVSIFYDALGLDLSVIEHCSPFELNAGSQKILSLVLCLIKQSPIILLDEIETSLSLVTTLRLVDLLQKMKKGKIIICVSHDNMFINKVADRILLLKKDHTFQWFESPELYFKSQDFDGVSKENLDILINKDRYLFSENQVFVV